MTSYASDPKAVANDGTVRPVLNAQLRALNAAILPALVDSLVLSLEMDRSMHHAANLGLQGVDWGLT